VQTFVIAGCGYLGMKIARQLTHDHHCQAKDILALVSCRASADKCLLAGLSPLILDLDNAPDMQDSRLTLSLLTPSLLTKAFAQTQPIVFYFIPPPPRGNKDTRANRFIELLSHMAAFKEIKKAAKIVLISTTGVYGNCHGQWVDESTPLNPRLDRAKRRVDAEQQFQAYCHTQQIPLVILRVAGLYAPDKLPVQRLKEKKPVVSKEDSPYSNRIHADDLVTVCVKAAKSTTIEGVYNCADGHPTTMYDYFLHVARFCQLPEPPVISLTQARTELSQGMLSYMGESRRIDNRKLLRDFAIQLKYPNLDKGLSRK
jgi:nucleoside-diphosphate-sugar epimerase